MNNEQDDIPLSEHIYYLRQFIDQYSPSQRVHKDANKHLNALDMAYRSKGAV